MLPWILIISAIGIALRLYGAGTELWLDEIWSINLVRGASSPLQILTETHSNNSHPLNSLYLYFTSDNLPFWFYRLPALTAGICTIPLAVILAGQHRTRADFFAAMLFSLSAVFVIYGSEARGYSMMCCLALLSLLLCQSVLAGQKKLLLLLWLSLILGILSHLNFIMFLAALFGWALLQTGRGRRALTIAQIFALPCLALLVLFFVYIKTLAIGTGSIYPSWKVVIEALAVPFGAPLISAWTPAQNMLSLCSAVLVCALLIKEIFEMRRDKDSLWSFYALIIFVLPALMLAAFSPRVVYLRYFLCSITFSFIVMASALARLWQKRLLIPLALLPALFLAGNTAALIDFSINGRGGYEKALTFIESHSEKDLVTVSSNLDFRSSTILKFYKARAGGLKQIISVPETELSSGSPANWYILQRDDRNQPAPGTLSDPSGNTYEMVAVFPCSILSGADWVLYSPLPLKTPAT